MHTFTYDTFGRITKIVQPGDTLDKPTEQYAYHYGSPRSWVKTEKREISGQDGVLTSITYYDGLGRKLQTRLEGEDGKVVVAEAVTFDLRGQVRDQYLSYYAKAATLDYAPPEMDKPKTTTLYDPLARTLKTINPDSTEMRTQYRLLAQDLYDEEDSNPASPHFNTPTTQRFDGLNRLVRVLERNGKETYTTSYTYDLLGHLTSITDAQGNVKHQIFDALGRKLSSDDPDRGHMAYTYDDAGNLLETVDAKGQHIRYTYDGANRLTTENYVAAADDNIPDVVYHYDDDVSPDYPDAHNTRGMLAWIEDPSGREYLSYDARGNLAGRIKRIAVPGSNSLDFVTLMRYDDLNRLVGFTYPDGTIVNYQYNAQSLLEAIPGYVANIDYAATGQRTAIATADGVTTAYMYDNRQRVIELRSANQPGTVLQDWRYGFDGAGNILHIDDLRPGPRTPLGARTPAGDDSRTFTLDDLYRLTSVRYTAGADHIDYAYDAIGNLIKKTSNLPALNLGEMRYGQTGPRELPAVPTP